MKIRRWFVALPLRMKTLFLKRHVEDELEEEFQFHLDRKVEELVERGASMEEARVMAKKALGVERQKEQCRDVRAGQWVERLRADVVFGGRQLMKRKVTTAAAVLSLGLAIGACMAAFLLVDALFLRPLPVSHPERLYGVFRQGSGFGDGKPDTETSFEYPIFQQMRNAVKDKATLIGVSSRQTDVTYGAVQEMERARIQYVSGSTFGTFGLRPVLGRLLTESDDVTPGAHPVAVLSYDYWTRRFGRDPHVIGRVLHMGDSDDEMGDNVYQIVGVGPRSFTGTEPGVVTDIFLPAMMYVGVKNADWSWIGMFVELKPGASAEAVGEQLNAVFDANQRERAKGFSGRPKQFLERFFSWHVKLEPSAAGISSTQGDYRLPMTVLGLLVAMVLLIACANVANLISAQAAARAREMAVRMSMGAGRLRLIRLVMVENCMVGAASAALGVLFAWWAAPFVVRRINTPDHPVWLALTTDWKVVVFGVALTVGVTLLFGLSPALRVSGMQPMSALKGREEPQAKRRLMYGLIGAQVAFCFVVLFVAGLFTTTFANLMKRPLGFVAERVLLLDTTAQHPQPAEAWEQMVEQLSAAPGVEKVGLSSAALLSGEGSNSYIAVNGVAKPALASMAKVSPGWLGTMRIPLIDGRDFGDRDGEPGVPKTALVSKSFAKEYFGAMNPVGRLFVTVGSDKPLEVIGVVGDARYQSVRETTVPVFYVPFQQADDKGVRVPIRSGTFNVRLSGDDPMGLGETLRRMIVREQPEFRVTNIRTEQELIDRQTVRERLLMVLGGFFAVMALLLAAVGLYGVLHYSVVQREREIGVRLALGAEIANIARLVTMEVFVMVLAGAAVGVVFGMASVRYVEALLYGVKGNDPVMLALPTAVLLLVALLAALPRAGRIDPSIMLRAE